MHINHWDHTRMIYVIQESVKLEMCMQIPGVYWSQGRFSYIFFNNLPSCGGHIVCILILFFIWLQAKCLQLDFNFKANN